MTRIKLVAAIPIAAIIGMTGAIAQETADEPADAGTGTEQVQNRSAGQQAAMPHISAIEDENERIEALSRLIGQSYDNDVPAGAMDDADKEWATASGSVTVYNLTDMFGEKVALDLQIQAEANTDNIGKLQDSVAKNNRIRGALETEGYTELDVVGVQYFAGGSAEVYVIPDAGLKP